MVVHQSLDCFVVVVICGCADMDLSDIVFCVFSVGSICVGLMFWMRVVVAFLMFCLTPF